MSQSHYSVSYALEDCQHWTPRWVAEAMAAYVLADRPAWVLDPAVGSGALLAAVKRLAATLGYTVRFAGAEIDSSVLAQAEQQGLSAEELGAVYLGDFFDYAPPSFAPAIIANPPYVRHHGLGAELKKRLGMLATRVTGLRIDQRAGLHVYFLIRSLDLLAPNGRLAFLLPADTTEGIFAPALWQWITKRYRIDAVITFTPEASPFQGLHVNPVIVMLRRSAPNNLLMWACVQRAETQQLREWVQQGFPLGKYADLVVAMRSLSEALDTGLSRPPGKRRSSVPQYVISDYMDIRIGISTGANAFFVMTQQQAERHGLPIDIMRRVVPNFNFLSDVQAITLDLLNALDAQGVATWLLYLPDAPLEALPEAVQRYLQSPAAAVVRQRPTMQMRKSWYCVERMEAPPIIGSYFSRGMPRWWRNPAGALPLSNSLAIYPRAPFSVEQAWAMLHHADVIRAIRAAAKSYGHDVIKLEPGTLRRVPVPENVARRFGEPTQPMLWPTTPTQMLLFNG